MLNSLVWNSIRFASDYFFDQVPATMPLSAAVWMYGPLSALQKAQAPTPGPLHSLPPSFKASSTSLCIQVTDQYPCLNRRLPGPPL